MAYQPSLLPLPTGDGLGSGQRWGEASSKRAPATPASLSELIAMLEKSIPPGASSSSEGRE